MKINLAKCKIGQRVKMSDGRITKIIAIDKNSKEWPLRLEDCGWYNNNGDSIVPTCQADIMAILPLPKKKAKTATPKNPANQASQRRILAKIEADFDRLGAAIARLKEAFEP